MLKLIFFTLTILSSATKADAIKLRCLGSYPNWNVEVNENYIRYKTPTESNGVSLAVIEQKTLVDGKLIIRSAFSTLVAVPNDECRVDGSRQSFSYAISFGENIGNSIIPSAGCCIKL